MKAPNVDYITSTLPCHHTLQVKAHFFHSTMASLNISFTNIITIQHRTISSTSYSKLITATF